MYLLFRLLRETCRIIHAVLEPHHLTCKEGHPRDSHNLSLKYNVLQSTMGKTNCVLLVRQCIQTMLHQILC